MRSRGLVDPYRGELHAHCYRMLGSLHDAEDALQEALLRAWRGLARFEGRARCGPGLPDRDQHLPARVPARQARAPARVRPAAGRRGRRPLAESVWLEPLPDGMLGIEDGRRPEARYEQRESVELAFVAALQHLPAASARC